MQLVIGGKHHVDKMRGCSSLRKPPNKTFSYIWWYNNSQLGGDFLKNFKYQIIIKQCAKWMSIDSNKLRPVNRGVMNAYLRTIWSYWSGSWMLYNFQFPAQSKNNKLVYVLCSLASYHIAPLISISFILSIKIIKYILPKSVTVFNIYMFLTWISEFLCVGWCYNFIEDFMIFCFPFLSRCCKTMFIVQPTSFIPNSGLQFISHNQQS